MLKNCKNLVQLWLDRNEIEIIPNDLFQNLSKLEQLLLGNQVSRVLFIDVWLNVKLVSDNNKIKNLTRQMFKNLGRLKRLILNENEIETLASNTFKDLASVEEIDLSMNLTLKFSVLSERFIWYILNDN